MQFALNYSAPAADLLRKGTIQIDRFKCWAWPDLIASVQRAHRLYVHFPLRVGAGSGHAFDKDAKAPADWHQIERVMVKTDTPQVNLHLEATGEDHPDIPVNTDDAAHVELVTEHLIKDVRPVVARFGPERVVVENDHPARGYNLRPVYLPEVIRRVVRETGCGLLLDVGHARLAAHTLGVDLFDYLGQLPTDRLCELHITGMQRFEGRWAQLARRAGFDEATIQEHIGYLVDHLPITDDGWQVYAWAMNQVHQGAWARPWIVTFEYGGADGVWEIMTDPAVLAEQVPRLYRLVKGEATAGEGPEETASR